MKQWEMKTRFPDVDYFLGDVRDIQRLRMAFFGVDIVIHAAALKIVPSGESDPQEYVKTNVIGSSNVIEAAISSGVDSVVLLSTDKACKPVNLYGSTKRCAEQLFLAANSYNSGGKPKFSVVRYGNVMGSRGSIIPLFRSQAAKGERITITHPEMTRFMISLEDAVDLVVKAISDPVPKVHIPRLPSMKVTDIASVVAPGVEQVVIGVRPGEKLHEELDEGYTSDKPERWYETWELRNWLESNYGPLASKRSDFSTPSSHPATR